VCFPSYVPCLIPVCAMSHSYVSHDSLLRLPWLIPMCDVNHFYVYHDPHLCVPRLMNHQCCFRDMISFKKKRSIGMPGLIFVCVAHHSMTHIYVYNDSYLWVWRNSYVCHESHLSVECVMDQSFKDVISQPQIWAFERGKGTVHLPMYLRTHTLTYTYAFAHAHTHICTHIPPTANRIKIEPE